MVATTVLVDHGVAPRATLAGAEAHSRVADHGSGARHEGMRAQAAPRATLGVTRIGAAADAPLPCLGLEFDDPIPTKVTPPHPGVAVHHEFVALALIDTEHESPS